MQFRATFLALAFVLSTGVMADVAHQEQANHKRFVIKREPLAGLPAVGGLTSGLAGDDPSGPVSVGAGNLLTGRDPLAGVPSVGGLTSPLGAVKNLVPLPLAGRAPLAGVPSVGGLTSPLGAVKNLVPLPLAGRDASLGGLTQGLGLNQAAGSDSLVPLSLGARDPSAALTAAHLKKTVQRTTAKLGATQAQLAKVLGSKKPASQQALINTFKGVANDLRVVTAQLNAVKVSPKPAEAGSNSVAAPIDARDLTLDGLLADLIYTVNGLLNQIEPAIKDLLEGVLGAVSDALKPYAGQLILAINGLLVTVESLVVQLGIELGPVLQPILDIVQNLATALGINLST
ncbi:hypothetical protein CF319_g4889 [Tilletia indica]|nr:hypothetical protein CF319_g4889 [Tilletia indica]